MQHWVSFFQTPGTPLWTSSHCGSRHSLFPNTCTAPSSMQWLSLAHNLLTGPIPPALKLPPTLRMLILGNNTLSGQVPQGWVLPSLENADIRNNELEGRLPYWTTPANATILPVPQLGQGFCGPVSSLSAGFVTFCQSRDWPLPPLFWTCARNLASWCCHALCRCPLPHFSMLAPAPSRLCVHAPLSLTKRHSSSSKPAF
jgi:hypothetical protein